MEAVVIPGDGELDELKSLAKSGRTLQAWERVRGMAPLREWPAGKPREVASRLLAGLGAERLSDALDLRNWRERPGDHDAFLMAQFVGLRRGRMLETQAALVERLEAEDLDDKQRSWMLALDGWLDGYLADFKPAHAKTDAALELRPEDPWLHVEKALVLQAEDRYAEALEFARRGLELRSGYRPAVFLLADVLTQLMRDEEAEQVLWEAHEGTEHYSYAGRLQAFHSEREAHERGLHYLDEYERRAPLLEDGLKKWVAGRRADFHYMAGRIDECIAWSDRKGKGFQQKVAERLREPGTAERRRKRLDVKFVRQHRMTCAPATLAAIAAYWGKEVDHLAIAEAICHDGTPWHKERGWAVEHGFAVREFRVTRESAMVLIDREVPFTLTTSWVTGAHLQACIGYDDRQGTLLLRDPTHRHFGEILVEGLIGEHPVDGPRGMVLVPREREEELLAGADLPDTDVYDALHDLAVALDGHDRLRAAGALAMMRAAAPEHPLVLYAENRMAHYDRDVYGQVAVVEQVVERFPESESWKYRLLGALQRAGGSRARRAEILKEVVRAGKCDPVFLAEYGELLSEDAREHGEAERWLRKSVRRSPKEARNYASLAYLKSKMERHDEAMRCRRVASCLSSGFEGYAEDYFRDCRWNGRVEEGLEYLRERVERVGGKASGPWLTLTDALGAMERDEEAQEVLEEALVKMPEDGELLLAGARKMQAWGRRGRGGELLEAAREKVDEAAWFRAAAAIASFRGNRVRALECWRRVVDLQPANVGGHRSLAGVLDEEEGRVRVLEHLERVVGRYPEDVGFLSLQAEWLGREEPGRSLVVLRRLLELAPNNIWARRELAWQLDRTGEVEEALEQIDLAIEKAPEMAQGYGMKGGIYYRAHRYEEAVPWFEKAVRLDVDYDYAVNHLMGAAERLGTVEATLALLREEIARQVSDGSVVMTYRQRAYQFVEPNELLEQLRGFTGERPDLWQTWAMVSRQALDMGEQAGAEEACEEMVRRFPLLPRVWVERSVVHSAAGRYGEEIEDLERTLELSPAWDWAARRLAEVLERVGRYDDAVDVMGRAVAAEPLTPANYGYLAELFWRMERRDEAFDCLVRGVDRCPSYEWGWGTLASWAVLLGREEEIDPLLAAGRERLSWKSEWWLMEAEVLDNLGRPEAALEVVREGLRRDRLEQDLHDRHAMLLADLMRFDEALEACVPEEFSGTLPRELQGRRAWVLMASGQPVRAIAAMKEIVAKWPEYGWAQRQLMAWLSERSDWAPLREAAKRLIRQEPSNARAWGYLAEAAAELGKREEAREALDRAFKLEPEYTYAGRCLLDYEIADRDWEAAHRTLGTLEHYSPSGWVTVDGIDLALAEGDEAEVRRRTRVVLEDREQAPRVLGYAKSLFDKAKRTGVWDGMVREVIATGRAGPAVLEVWSQRLCEVGKVPAGIRKLEKLEVPFGDKVPAWATFVEDLAEKNQWDVLHRVMKRHREEFRGHKETWSSVGYALLSERKEPEVVEWFRDWRGREDEMTPINFLNLSAALDRTEGPDAAREVRAAALRMFPADDHAGNFRAGLAWSAARAGETGAAEEQLAEIEMDRAMDYYRAVALLARAMLAARRGDENGAGVRFREAVAILGEWRKLGSSRNYVEGAADVLAAHLPWAGGKRRKVLKRLAGDGAIEWWKQLWWILLGLWVLWKLAQNFLE